MLAQTPLSDSYIEPSEKAEIDIEEWNKVPEGLNITWCNKDIQIPRFKVPNEGQRTDTVVYAWRGERVSLKGLMYSKNDIDELVSIDTQTLNPLAIANASFLRYVTTDAFNTCGYHPNDLPPYTVADVIDIPEKPFNNAKIKACEIRPFWININIGLEVEANKDYDVKTIIKCGNTERVMNIKVKVLDRTLPHPDQYTFYANFWQQPYSVSRYYGVKPWSDEHIELLKPYMRRLARTGQKVISTILFYEPWGEQSNDKFEPMVQTILTKKGKWKYDYTVFDKYVKMMMSCGIHTQIECYSMVPWDMNFRYWDEKSNDYKFLKTKTTEKEYKELWTSFLKGFAKHLKSKGWFDRTCIAMDERGLNDMLNAYKIAQEAVPGIKMMLAGNYHKELVDILQDYTIAYGQRFTKEELEARRNRGQHSMVYTCCTEPNPNIFSNSQPCEAAFLPLFCMAQDFDGYLHWSYMNWTDEPLTDTRFKLFAPGDTYFIYPDNRSSVRYERFLEGVQQFEKIKIMRKEWAKNNDTESNNRLDVLLEEIGTGKASDTKRVAYLVNEVEKLLNK